MLGGGISGVIGASRLRQARGGKTYRQRWLLQGQPRTKSTRAHLVLGYYQRGGFILPPMLGTPCLVIAAPCFKARELEATPLPERNAQPAESTSPVA